MNQLARVPPDRLAQEGWDGIADLFDDLRSASAEDEVVIV
jgi:hypothetical protein